MWAYFTTIKMKNIGDGRAIKEITKLMKKCDDSCSLVKVYKNSIKFVSYDMYFYDSVFELFSKKYKNQIVATSSSSIHNPYSSKPERFENIYWHYYKDGREILKFVRTEKGVNKYYKVVSKVADYDSLILETSAKNIIDFYGDDKDILKFFNIKDIKKSNSKVSVPYYDYIYEYGNEFVDYIFDDVECKKDKKITRDEFLSNFAKNELVLFKRDFIIVNK